MLHVCVLYPLFLYTVVPLSVQWQWLTCSDEDFYLVYFLIPGQISTCVAI